MRRACKGAEMRSSLAMLFYIDYKCSTQPGFRKTFLVLLLIFAFLVWSPWRPGDLCSALYLACVLPPLCEVILPLSLSLNLAAKNAPHASHQLRIQ